MPHSILKRIALSSVPAIIALLLAGSPAFSQPATLVITADQPGQKIGPLFYGLMTEEINHSYDGGLYAELIQNRIFKDKPDKPIAWSAISTGPAAAIAIDETNPVNTIALTRSLRLDIPALDAGQRAGVANSGFWGIPVSPNTKYHASFYARASDDFSGPLTVDIESNDGATTFASGTVPAITNQWKKYQLDLTTGDVPPSTTNRFVISAASKGSIWFSLVSLFPPTYHDRPNGNRIDIMQKLADLHPAFLRFPGGNFLEGDRIVDHFDWKKTIGPLEERPGHNGCWGYHVSDGMGLLEFLEWCEDLKMEPLLAVYAGYSLQGAHVDPGPDLQPFVQEALDEIEYCTGDTTTTWGARLASDGHPDPFVIHYVEIGNEDWFDKSGSYDGRFTQIFNAIKAKYPQIQCIATMQVHSSKPDLVDDHAYPSIGEMLRMTHRYDNYDPTRPKVFFGEWASQEGRPTPTLRAALADAAWLTGLQTDSETVLLNCYAPLFVNVNKGANAWSTNLIGYNANTCFGSPSYYAQAMFANNLGDVNLPTTLSDLPTVTGDLVPLPHGAIGVGTWRTSAQFTDVKVSHDGQTLFQSDFSNNLSGWKQASGTWNAADGAAQQTNVDGQAVHITAGDSSWHDYTLTLKARKTAGEEGFLILFHASDPDNYYWFNVGGWQNTRSAIEVTENGGKSEIGTSTPFSVETGKWYNIRVELQGRSIKCYLDDKLQAQTDGAGKPTPRLFAAASKDQSTGDIILKFVNTTAAATPFEIKLNGVASVAKEASGQILTGNPSDVNSPDTPTKDATAPLQIDNASTDFVHEFPAYSLSVIRFKPQP